MKIWLSSRLIRFRPKQGERHEAKSQGVLCHSVYLFLFPYTNLSRYRSRKIGELSKLFCEWRKMSNEGKAADPALLDRINRILKEEQKEKTK